jgi:predicted nucleic acid-binding protein
VNYLLDTTVLIHYLRGRLPVVVGIQDLSAAGHTLMVCPVNVAEIYSGTRPEDEQEVSGFIRTLTYVPISFEAAEFAGRLRYRLARAGLTLHMPDALIGATGLQEDATLLTSNVKDFSLVPELRVQPFPARDM